MMAAETSSAAPTATGAAAMRQQVAKALPGKSAFVPVLLLALALVGWLALQGVLLVLERQQLGALQAGLDPQVQTATKLRSALDTLATSTAKLSADGNATARTIVEQLRQRGITINPGGTPKPP